METKDIIAGYKAWRDNGAKEVSLSREQVYTLLYNWPGFNAENPSTGYGYGGHRPMGEFFGALTMPGVLEEPEAPAKPAYLPIKRKVRWADLEDGCVLRYCGNDLFDHHQDHGMLVVGDLYTIRKDERGSITIPYTTPNTSRVVVEAGDWTGISGNDPWEFVSNPNYVHGFRIGETVYCMNGDGGDRFQKLTIRARQYPSRDTRLGWVACDGEFHGGLFNAATLTRDPTKAYGYKAPVEYKVKDGVAKEGDVIWWLASYGDPEKVIVGGLNWDRNENNVKSYPHAYQLREPQKVWDYKNK